MQPEVILRLDMRVFAVILAAGKGERFGSDKVLQDLGGKPVWRWSYDLLSSHESVSGVGLVCSDTNIAAICPEDAAFIIVGGKSRQESSLIGIENCPSGTEIVLIHDGARPFLTNELVNRLISALSTHQAAIPGNPVIDTIKRVTKDGILNVERDGLVSVQTPQAARIDTLKEAHDLADREYTDESALLESLGIHVELVQGEPRNFKITLEEDLERARMMIQPSRIETRIGLGFDVHRFSEDESLTLMLGGVAFPGEKALEGHSDADVIVHAVVDALLGSVAAGDIGQLFPNDDPANKNRASREFLEAAREIVAQTGFIVVNIDIAVIAEFPKIMKRSTDIRKNIAETLGIDPSRISVKATTNERLGSIGRGEGIAAHAVASVSGPSNGGQ